MRKPYQVPGWTKDYYSAPVGDRTPDLPPAEPHCSDAFISELTMTPTSSSRSVAGDDSDHGGAQGVRAAQGD